MIAIAREYRVALPAWIDDELSDVPAVVPGREDRMRLVHRLADRNWREGDGGPFAALVAERDTGRIVSVGVNVVLASGVSSAHAEVVALGLAQTATGGWDLGATGLPAHELVVNWRPCIQCYGATM
jgi:tRNA(Arg) A34 adenosine deaminase TadA